MAKRQRGTKGVRNFEGRYYLLAARGTREECERLATTYRATQYVRIVPYNPFYQKRYQDLFDDFAVFTFPKEPR